MGVATVALIDTDSDPDVVDLPIPGNDDSIRSIELMLAQAGRRGAGRPGGLAARDAGEPRPRPRPHRPRRRPAATAPAAAARSRQRRCRMPSRDVVSEPARNRLPLLALLSSEIAMPL